MIGKDLKTKAKEVRVLVPNTAAFFGPPMEVHGQIVKHLDSQVHKVFVATHNEGDSADRFRGIGNAKVREYNLGSTFNSAKNPAAIIFQLLRNLPVILNLLRISWLIRRERIQIIHCASEPRAAFVALILAFLNPIKLVVQVHVWNLDRGFLTRAVVSRLLLRANIIIADSHFIERELIAYGIPPTKVRTVWPGVNNDAFHPELDGAEIRSEFNIDRNAPLIVTVGRVTEQKGQKHLVEAMLEVKHRLPEVKALLVGWQDPARLASGKTYQEELREFCLNNALGDTVIFAGPRSDTSRVFAAADVVVVPSVVKEAFGLVVVEAMSSGKAVIGSDAGAIPELLADGAGEVVPHANSDALAKSIIRVLTDSSVRRRLGRNARARIDKEFREGIAAERVAQIYQELT